MDLLRISGPRPLHGTVSISGSKNAALPVMAASLLTDQVVELRTGGFAKATCRSKHSRGDDHLEAADELGPRGPVFRACACGY